MNAERQVNNMWLKIKIWTKGIVFGAMLVYALLFIFNNVNKGAKLWFWFGREPETPLLVLVVACFGLGVVLTLLVRTILGTIRQIRELRARTRAERLEQEVADMKSKAAMLQTKSSISDSGVESDATSS